MIAASLFVSLLLLQSAVSPPPHPAPCLASSTAPSVQAETSAKLARIRRIFVESFGDDPISREMQAMVINSLSDSHRFIITEKREKADAVLKATALEKTSQELHATGEGTAVGGAAGSHSSSLNGSFVDGSGSVSGSSSGGFVARSAAITDSQASTETINDARVAARLVDSDGDVVWATTKESHGAKYKGASADAADQVVKQLLHDLDKLQPRAASAASSPN